MGVRKLVLFLWLFSYFGSYAQQIDDQFNPFFEAYADSYVIHPVDDSFIVGGDYYFINQTSQNRIVAIRESGNIDNSINFGSGFDGAILSIDHQSDGGIIVGGLFKSYNGVAVNNLARLNADGSLDQNFASNIGNGPSYIVRKVVVQDDDRVLVGGDFGDFGTESIGPLVRLMPDGTVDGSFSGRERGPNNSVNDIAITQEGDIVICGSFGSFRGESAYKSARISPSGDLINAYHGPGDIIYTNLKVLVTSSNEVLFGGFYADINADGVFDVPGLRKFTIEGSAIEEFVPANDVIRVQWILAEDEAGRILVVDKNQQLIRLNTDGSIDHSFQTATRSDPKSLYVKDNGNYIVSYPGEIIELNSSGDIQESGFSTDVGTLAIVNNPASVIPRDNGEYIVSAELGQFEHISRINGEDVKGWAVLNGDGSINSSRTSEISVDATFSVEKVVDDKVYVRNYSEAGSTNEESLIILNSWRERDPTFTTQLRPYRRGAYSSWYPHISDNEEITLVGYVHFQNNDVEDIAKLHSNGKRNYHFGYETEVVSGSNGGEAALLNDGRVVMNRAEVIDDSYGVRMISVNPDGTLTDGFPRLEFGKRIHYQNNKLFASHASLLNDDQDELNIYDEMGAILETIHFGGEIQGIIEFRDQVLVYGIFDNVGDQPIRNIVSINENDYTIEDDFLNGIFNAPIISTLVNENNEVLLVSGIIDVGSADAFSLLRKVYTGYINPPVLSYEIISLDEVLFSWEDNSHIEESYNLLKSSDGETFELFETFNSSDSEYISSDSEISGQYFKVEVVGRDGSRAESNIQYVEFKTPTPKNVKTEITSGSEVKITWETEVDFINSFDLYRKNNDHTELLVSLSGDQFEYLDSDVSNGEVYEYWITAHSDLGESNDSDEVIVTFDFAEVPENLSIEVLGNLTFKLTWTDQSDNEGSYEVYRSLDEFDGYQSIAQLAPNSEEFIDSNADFNVLYYYKLVLINGVGTVETEPVQGIIPVPKEVTNIESSVVVDQLFYNGRYYFIESIKLTWDYEDESILGFHIYRSTDGVNFDIVSNLDPGVREKKDSSGDIDKLYYFKIVPYNEYGESLNSEIITQRFVLPPTRRPNVEFEFDNESQVDITIIHEGEGHRYQIFRKLNPEDEFELIADLPPGQNTFSDIVTPNNTYYYEAVYFNEGGPSPPRPFTVHAWLPMARPTNFSFYQNEQYEAVLSWEDNTDFENGYAVYRSSFSYYSKIAELDPNATTYTDGSISRNSPLRYFVAAVNPGQSSHSDTLDVQIDAPPYPPYFSIYSRTDSVQIVFYGVSAAQGYKVYRSLSQEDGYEEVADIPHTAGRIVYYDSSLPKDVTNYYKIGTYNGFGEDMSDRVLEMTIYSQPGPAQDIQASAGEDGITINWLPGEGMITSYNIYRNDYRSGYYSNLGQIESDELTYVDNSIMNNEVYYYYLISNNNTRQSERSDTVEISRPGVPEKASSVYARQFRTDYVNISWNSVRYSDGYKIYRGLSEDFEEAILIADVERSIIDENVEGNRMYYYWVVAYNQHGEAEPSDWESIFVETQPAIPSNLKIEVTETELVLSWEDNADNETGYEVYRRELPFGYPRAMGSMSPNTVTYSEAKPERDFNYEYYVVAFNSAWISDPSNSVTAAVSSPLISAPHGIAPSFDRSNLWLSWYDDNPEEIREGYIVYRKTWEETEFHILDSIPGSERFYYDRNLISGRTYTYKVAVFNAAYIVEGEELAIKFTGPPAMPSYFHSLSTEDGILLRWKDNSIDEVKFTISKYSQSESSLLNEVTVPANTTEYLDGGVELGEEYKYLLRVSNSRYTTGPILHTHIHKEPVNAPTGLNIEERSIGFLITWIDNSTNEEGFLIYRREVGEDTFVELSVLNPDITTYRDTSTEGGKTYIYKVVAFDDESIGESDEVMSRVNVTTGINDMFPDIILYPNPVFDFLTLSGIPESATRISIVTLKGSMIRSRSIPLLSDNFQIDVIDIPSGMYILVIEGVKVKAIPFYKD